ncbi:PhzF family phenazine biosynthesis protein [Parvularcula sp. IMCC14364]|uniref:PhzF family phenazine biosynthesis protein n=1 Tax=Parvularcula sp. IMCC14364 TaxID=3067902 RepID=UPI0027422E8D|nr:PhzF family phenazine biosynthesis isomerase [Parvularcula sp. IMCC14364]
MTEYDIYQADAFADEVFKGNPAAVVPLQEWLPDETLQAIAIENNLSETAYVIDRGQGKYDLRWFTPGAEVDLCGHATLATAHILCTELGATASTLKFATRSGELVVSRDGQVFMMDFPAYLNRQEATDQIDLIEQAIGVWPLEVWSDAFLLAILPDAGTVRELQPDIFRIEQLRHHAHDGCLLVTAPGDDGFDFVSRFFAPGVGILEDPVTGSAHCMTAPYWAEKLGMSDLSAFQASPRGGKVQCLVKGDRVILRGQAVTYLRGRISF